MSMYSASQRCPRCQYPFAPGAATCQNCGLALSGQAQTPYGAEPLLPPPLPPASPYGGAGYGGAGRYDFTNQPAPAYPGSAPAYGGSPPAYPGSQPQSGFGAQPAQKGGSGLKIAIIVLVIMVVLGAGGGVAAYLLTRPKPTIDVTSTYHNGSTPAGATTTVFTVTGQKFSGNSTITFLLDNKPAPDAQTALSDGNGNVRADLMVSANWGVGSHILTARDANDYTTHTGVAIVIVNQGEDNTPGPNGAPTDSSSFKVSATVMRQDASTGKALNPFPENLTIQGQAQANQQVCDPQVDEGQVQTFNGTDNTGAAYKETFTLKCSGSYKGGKLSYTETTTSDKISYSNGITCHASTPYVFTEMDGTFTSATQISGTYNADIINYTCSNNSTLHTDPEKGTWTGTASSS